MARMRAEALLRVLPLCLAAACAVDGSAEPPTPAAPPDEPPAEASVAEFVEAEDVLDGAWLYERNCSGCHGMQGKGDGQTGKDLGVQPRDFAAGGFSFGNTPEDLFRTISAGIPGRSVMPAFGGLLSEEERRSIVEHVLTLMPPQEVQDPAASVLHVGPDAQVARGKLPPAAEGRAELPRGLLLGLPAGLTFEYDVQDVAPVAVRLGAFCDREDWRGRGGGYLRPLGTATYLYSRERAFRADGVPLRGRLTATFEEGPAAGLEYELLDAGGRVRARVIERVRAVPLSAGGAFRRELEVSAVDAALRLDALVAGDERTRFERAAPPWYSGPRRLSADVAGDVEAVYLELPANARAATESGALRAHLELMPGSAARLAAVPLLLPDDGAQRLAVLAAEIAR
jgi:mono/diheme cytochrome c family protein